jgi:LacI family transcriptional regulator
VIRRIAIFYGLYSDSARGILRGVNAFARPNKPWVFRWTMNSLAILPQLADWDPHGILAYVGDAKTRDALLALGKPLVDVANCVSHPDLPLVTWKDSICGEAAASHFIERGFIHFAFLGLAARNFSRERMAGFHQRLRAAGFDCQAHLSDATSDASADAPSWRHMDTELRAWVTSLPKPVGIFVDSDGYAIELVEACRQAGVPVPDDVAILAVGDDETACHAVFPPLSSVKLHGEGIGYAAAELLERLMNGGRVPAWPRRFPPGEIVARQSSDAVAMEDPRLADAARFIRQHAHEGVIVKDLLAEVAIGRRELERGFRRVLGRTPLQEIHRIRIARAKQLLEATDHQMPTIAHLSGFLDSKSLAVTFKRISGESPTNYRRRFRVRES